MDNILAEFRSVVEAVRCAVKIQETLKGRNVELPENRRMEFRIGVNLGDVIEEEGRTYGDGVNIAARLEALAELNKAVRLNPMSRDFYLHEFGSCYRLMGRYDEAIAVLKRVLDGNPNYPDSRLNLITTYVMSGKEEAARAEAMELLRQSPDFSVERILEDFPYKDQKIRVGLKECWLRRG